MRKHAGCKYPYLLMNIGDSFFIPNMKSTSMSCQLNSFSKNHPGYAFVTHKATKNGVIGLRVWRVESNVEETECFIYDKSITYEYEVEHNIPIPEGRIVSTIYPYRKMKVGEIFLIRNKPISTVRKTVYDFIRRNPSYDFSVTDYWDKDGKSVALKRTR